MLVHDKTLRSLKGHEKTASLWDAVFYITMIGSNICSRLIYLILCQSYLVIMLYKIKPSCLQQLQGVIPYEQRCSCGRCPLKQPC